MAPSLRIEIFPADIARAIRFYTDLLGFELIRHEPELVAITAADGSIGSIDKGYAYLVNGSIYLGVAGIPPEGSLPVEIRSRRPPTGVELVIEVDHLESVREQIRKHGWPVRPDEEIEMQKWGLRDFRIEDPDGYFLRISEKGTRNDGTGF